MWIGYHKDNRYAAGNFIYIYPSGSTDLGETNRTANGTLEERYTHYY